MFFVYSDKYDRLHSRLKLYVILYLVYHWLLSTKQVAFNVGVSVQTVTDWVNQCCTTVGKSLEKEPLFVGTNEQPVEKAHLIKNNVVKNL